MVKSKNSKVKVKESEQGAASGAAGYLGSSKSKKVIKAYKSVENIKHWWLEKPDQLYVAIESVLGVIEQSQTSRRLRNIKFAQMYGNYEVMGAPFNAFNNNQGNQANENIPRLNIIQSVIDAVAAKIAKDQPKVSFVTNGANDYFLKLRAEKLSKYIYGIFKQSKLYENSELVFRDSEVVGTGFLKIFVEDDQIKTEWVYTDEIRVDELDGIKQKPRSIHQVKLVPRDTVLEDYPEFADKIINCQAAVVGKLMYQTTTDVIKVVESWHLPTKKNAANGVHCITIENATLMHEKYTKDYFPIVAFRWYNRPLGFYGRSITEEIYSGQIEINKLLWTIQQAQELAACPIIFVENSSQVSEDVLLSNTIARMVPFSGQMPQWVSPQALSAEVYQHLNSWIQWCYQIVGLSQDAASGMKQPGVESAVAIREVADIETGRFAMVAKRWEQFFVDVARIMVDMSKDLYEDNPDLSVNVNDKNMLQEFKWSKVNLEDNPFDISTFPTSQLPDTPAGRIQTISEYIANQWITKERGMELLNLDPDLEGEVKLQTAPLRLTEKYLSLMVEDGEPQTPDPFMNLALAQQVAQGTYNMLLQENCPEDRLQMVRDFIMACIEMQKPPPPPPQEMDPNAMPMDPNMPEGIPGTQPMLAAPPLQGPPPAGMPMLPNQ